MARPADEGRAALRPGDGAGTRDRAPDADRFARLWPLVWVVWMPLLAAPFTLKLRLLHAHPAPPRLLASLAGVALFAVIYLWAAWQNDVSRTALVAPVAGARGLGSPWLPVAVLAALSLAVTLGDGPGWLILFIFTSASAGSALPPRQATLLVAALVLVTAALGGLLATDVPDLVQTTFLVGVVGAVVMTLSWAVTTSRVLRAARAENDRLAVAAKRLRFARDLHDLLGHNLALIAVKGELAEALIATAPERAATEMRAVQDAARLALQEVRAAVAGYRQPTLASELRGAEEILAAAGIAYHDEGTTVTVPPATEAVLAWAVREGVTNVIRHSRATRCAIRLTHAEGHVGVEVDDDGPSSSGSASDATPSASAPGAGGSGLPGLAERVAALGGRYDASLRPEGGFRLSVTLPVAGTAGALARDAGGRR